MSGCVSHWESDCIGHGYVSGVVSQGQGSRHPDIRTLNVLFGFEFLSVVLNCSIFLYCRIFYLQSVLCYRISFIHLWRMNDVGCPTESRQLCQKSNYVLKVKEDLREY